MLYRTRHTTTYLYSQPVSICHTEVHLAPRSCHNQAVLDHQLAVTPEPDRALPRRDYFGNEVTYFSIHEPHQTLTITATGLVEVREIEPPQAGLTPDWEMAARQAREHATAEDFDAFQFLLESPRVKLGEEFAAYAAPSFPANRPLLEGTLDLCHRVYQEFEYDPRATTVTTPVDEVLASRRGVCQDFAHVTIACLRSLGLAARYVSGYLRSGPKSVGAEASHAWLSVYCPGFGWLDFDPTNDVMPTGNHVTVAWGRDYSDVTPVQGVALGGGEQIINVAVGVEAAP